MSSNLRLFMATEAETRQRRIGKQLGLAGWSIGSRQVVVELLLQEPNQMADAPKRDHSDREYVDYALMDRIGRHQMFLASAGCSAQSIPRFDRHCLANSPCFPIRGTLSPRIRQTASAESPTPVQPETVLRLSWSHLQELIAIDDPRKRAPRKTKN